MGTLLFVGAGRHQRRGILRARELGHRIVAVDRNRAALGLEAADLVELVDFADVERVAEVGRRHEADGVLTVAADRAVPVVAAVAEALGLPGIGLETARRMTQKVAMREALAAAGVPQPPFLALRSSEDAAQVPDAVGFPAVLKPADSGGQRGVFRVEDLANLERHVGDAFDESPTNEAIVEGFVDGAELNGIVVVRDGRADLLTLSDRLRPPGIGFGVGWIHVHPPSIDGNQLRRAREIALESPPALGMRDGIAFPQLIAATDGRVIVVEVAARIPGGQMADLVRHAVGVDLIQVAILQALGEEVPDEIALPRFSQPLAIRFLTAEPGPLPAGTVRSFSGLERVLAFPGVVQAEVYFDVGETIRPVRLDADRRGYVIAIGDTSVEALERAEAAARLLDVDVE